MNHYQAKLDRRREGLRKAAQKRREQGEALASDGRRALEAIPFGQPILIGHHSERGDRAYRGRAVGKIDRGYALQNEADALEARADSVGTGGISSDDPEALDRLQKYLEKLQEEQARMKRVNLAHAAYKKNPVSLETAELTQKEKELVRNFIQPYSWIKHPFAPYQMKNNNANIRRIEKRIELLKKLGTTPAPEPISGAGWTLHQDRDENRIVVKFAERQSEDITKILRSWGFLWSPSRTAWVRKITPNALYAAKRLAEALPK